MNYDTYGSSAVELAIDLANAQLNAPSEVVTFLTEQLQTAQAELDAAQSAAASATNGS